MPQGVALRELVKTEIERAFRGPNGNYPAVLEALRDVTASIAARTPEPYAWPELGGDEEAWQHLLRRLDDTHRRLLEAVDRVSDEALLGVVVPGWGPMIHLLLAGTAEHDSYHAGQIRVLAGMRGVTATRPTA